MKQKNDFYFLFLGQHRSTLVSIYRRVSIDSPSWSGRCTERLPEWRTLSSLKPRHKQKFTKDGSLPCLFIRLHLWRFNLH